MVEPEVVSICLLSGLMLTGPGDICAVKKCNLKSIDERSHEHKKYQPIQIMRTHHFHCGFLSWNWIQQTEHGWYNTY